MDHVSVLDKIEVASLTCDSLEVGGWSKAVVSPVQ